ncbi:MAG: hypothetical protein KatS3mg035_0326 [Bacteroidia bacterium]|nr:MAG: hypothetical protein KatS3mg035_0326 [Bacteroidia bacterium]
MYQSFCFQNKIFRVIPHQSQNILFIEVLNAQKSNLALYLLDLRRRETEFLLEYQDKQLLALAAFRFLVFKQFPSRILPIVKGIKIYDRDLKKFILEEPEAQNFEYSENSFRYLLWDKVQTITFPRQSPNHFLFPSFDENQQNIVYQNFKILFKPKKLEIYKEMELIFEYLLENEIHKNFFIMNSYFIFQTQENEISVLDLK